VPGDPRRHTGGSRPTIVRRALDQATTPERAAKLAEMIWRKSLAGDLEWTKVLLDRVLGPVSKAPPIQGADSGLGQLLATLPTETLSALAERLIDRAREDQRETIDIVATDVGDDAQ
jgi:hypothetical protein